jgi:ketosteroid isomerase-like protein
MSQQSVQRAREAYAALSRAVETGDFEHFLTDFLDPDVEWVPLPGSPDSVGAHRGHEAVRKRLGEMLEAMQEPRLEPREFIDAGEKTVVALLMRGRGKASGIAVDSQPFHVVTERDGKAMRIEWYATREDALVAAGLEQ